MTMSGSSIRNSAPPSGPLRTVIVPPSGIASLALIIKLVSTCCTCAGSAIIAAFERAVMPLFASGRIEPLIDRVFALEDVAEAHRTMEASRHFGKLVLALKPERPAEARRARPAAP
jgi:NADPH:quinone reductase-like Zn-dependent oxidoreductase